MKNNKFKYYDPIINWNVVKGIFIAIFLFGLGYFWVTLSNGAIDIEIAEQQFVRLADPNLNDEIVPEITILHHTPNDYISTLIGVGNKDDVQFEILVEYQGFTRIASGRCTRYPTQPTQICHLYGVGDNSGE